MVLPSNLNNREQDFEKALKALEKIYPTERFSDFLYLQQKKNLFDELAKQKPSLKNQLLEYWNNITNFFSGRTGIPSQNLNKILSIERDFNKEIFEKSNSLTDYLYRLKDKNFIYKNTTPALDSDAAALGVNPSPAMDALGEFLKGVSESSLAVRGVERIGLFPKLPEVITPPEKRNIIHDTARALGGFVGFGIDFALTASLLRALKITPVISNYFKKILPLQKIASWPYLARINWVEKTGGLSLKEILERAVDIFFDNTVAFGIINQAQIEGLNLKERAKAMLEDVFFNVLFTPFQIYTPKTFKGIWTKFGSEVSLFTVYSYLHTPKDMPESLRWYYAGIQGLALGILNSPAVVGESFSLFNRYKFEEKTRQLLREEMPEVAKVYDRLKEIEDNSIVTSPFSAQVRAFIEKNVFKEAEIRGLNKGFFDSLINEMNRLVIEHRGEVLPRNFKKLRDLFKDAQKDIYVKSLGEFLPEKPLRISHNFNVLSRDKVDTGSFKIEKEINSLKDIEDFLYINSFLSKNFFGHDSGFIFVEKAFLPIQEATPERVLKILDEVSKDDIGFKNEPTLGITIKFSENKSVPFKALQDVYDYFAKEGIGRIHLSETNGYYNVINIFKVFDKEDKLTPLEWFQKVANLIERFNDAKEAAKIREKTGKIKEATISFGHAITYANERGRGHYTYSEIDNLYKHRFAKELERVKQTLDEINNLFVQKEKERDTIGKSLGEISKVEIDGILSKFGTFEDEFSLLGKYGFKKIGSVKVGDLFKFARLVEDEIAEIFGDNRKIWSYEDQVEFGVFIPFGTKVEISNKTPADIVAELILYKLKADNNIKGSILNEQGENIEGSIKTILKNIYGLNEIFSYETGETLADVALQGIFFKTNKDLEISLRHKNVIQDTKASQFLSDLIKSIWEFYREERKYTTDPYNFVLRYLQKSGYKIKSPQELDVLIESFKLPNIKNLTDFHSFVLDNNPKLFEIENQFLKEDFKLKLIQDKFKEIVGRLPNLTEISPEIAAEVAKKVAIKSEKPLSFVDIDFIALEKYFSEAVSGISEQFKRFRRGEITFDFDKFLKGLYDGIDIIRRKMYEMGKDIEGFTYDSTKAYIGDKKTLGNLLEESIHVHLMNLLPDGKTIPENIKDFLARKGFSKEHIERFEKESLEAFKIGAEIWGKDISAYSEREKLFEGWTEVLKLLSIFDEREIRNRFPVVLETTKGLLGDKWEDFAETVGWARVLSGGYWKVTRGDATLQEQRDFLAITSRIQTTLEQLNSLNPQNPSNQFKLWSNYAKKLLKFFSKKHWWNDVILTVKRGAEEILEGIDGSAYLRKTLGQFDSEVKNLLGLTEEGLNFSLANTWKAEKVYTTFLYNKIMDGVLPALDFDNPLHLGEFYKFFSSNYKLKEGFNVGELMKAIDNLNFEERKTLSTYLIAKEHLARYERIEDYKAPFEPSFYESYVANVEREYPHLTQIAEKIAELNRFIITNYGKELYPYLTPKELEALQKITFYGHLFRDGYFMTKYNEEVFPSDFGKLFAVEGSLFPQEIDPLFSLEMTLFNLPHRLYRAWMSKVIALLAKDRGYIRTPDGRVLAQITKVEEHKPLKKEDLLREVKDEANKEFISNLIDADGIDFGLNTALKAWRSIFEKELLTVRIGDTTYKIEFLDKDLKNVFIHNLNLANLDEVFQKIAHINDVFMRFRKGSLTRWSLGFTVRNVIRDMFTTLFYPRGSFLLGREHLEGLRALFSNDPIAKDIKFALKSYEDSFLSRSTKTLLDKIKEEMVLEKNKDSVNFLTRIGDLIGNLNSFFEAAPRIGTMYKKLKEKLGGVRELTNDDWVHFHNAFIEALEVTHFWGTRGLPGKITTKTIDFFNRFSAFFRAELIAAKDDLLRLAGFDYDYRWSREIFLRNSLKLVQLTTIFTLIQMLLMKDEKYRTLFSDARRLGFINIPIPNTNLYLPLPLGIPSAYLANYIALTIASLAYDSQSPSLSTLGGFIFGGKLFGYGTLIDSFMPDIIQPLIEAYVNKSLWSGRYIESPFLEKIPVSLRGREFASVLGIGLSDALRKFGIEISPAKADYLLSSYLGAFYYYVNTFVEPFASLSAEGKIKLEGLNKTFLGDILKELNPSNSWIVNRFYEQTENYRKEYKEYERFLKEDSQKAAEYLEKHPRAIVYAYYIQPLEAFLETILRGYREIKKDKWIDYETKLMLLENIANNLSQFLEDWNETLRQIDNYYEYFQK